MHEMGLPHPQPHNPLRSRRVGMEKKKKTPKKRTLAVHGVSDVG